MIQKTKDGKPCVRITIVSMRGANLTYEIVENSAQVVSQIEAATKQFLDDLPTTPL